VRRPSITYDGLAHHPSRPPTSLGLLIAGIRKVRHREGRRSAHRSHPRTRLVTFFVLSSVLMAHSSAGRSGIMGDVPLSSLTHDCSLEFCFGSRGLFSRIFVDRDELKIKTKVFPQRLCWCGWPRDPRLPIRRSPGEQCSEQRPPQLS